MRNLFGLVICICFGLAMSTTYNWANGAGGDWSTASNWSPNGVPGPNDDVVISGDDTTVQNAMISLKGGSYSVASLRLDQAEYNYYLLARGAITVANEFYMSGGSLYKLNLTLNGDSKISCDRDDDVCNCDGCKVDVGKSLTFTYDYYSSFRKKNNALFTNLEGATTTINYNGVYFEGNNGIAEGTLINYGNLIFNATMLASPMTPYGQAQAVNTGSWKEILNYGLVEIQTAAYEVGLPLYSDVLHWGHLAGAKMNMRIYQPSTLTNSLFYNPDYEYNDHIATASRTDMYNCTLGGDLHVIFGNIDVVPGQSDRPFNPKIGNFFPIFVNNMCHGKWGTISSEGLPSGMVLGPLVNGSSENELVHYGVVICASTDTYCINGGGWDLPIPDHRVPFQGGGNTPDSAGTSPDGTSNPDSPSGSNPSNSPSGGSNPSNSPSRSNPNSPSANIKTSIAASTTLTGLFVIVMTVLSLIC